MSSTIIRRHVAIYIDGSCIPQSDKIARRAGIGISFGIGHKYNVSEALPGAKQTSARAELAAAVRAIGLWQKHEPTLELHLFSDNTYAILEVNRILKPKEYKQIGGERENGDLIRELERLINIRKAEIRVFKVPAHSNNLLNDDADRLAKTAARKAYELSKNNK